MRNVINFLGVNVDVLDTDGLYQRVVKFVNEERPHKVMYVNTDCMLISKKDTEYRRILNNSDLVYADGIGVVWGAKLFGRHLPDRSTGADFMPIFCKGFARRGYRLYFLGARPGVAQKAANRLKQAIPELNIVGVQDGYFKPEENQKITDDIIRTKPDILLVGLGAPHQEKWIEKNLHRLNIPVVWGVGGLFDFLSGRLRRGHKLLLDNGFEWLCRLFVEPRRLWRRYFIGTINFSWYMVQFRFLIADKTKKHQ